MLERTTLRGEPLLRGQQVYIYYVCVHVIVVVEKNVDGGVLRCTSNELLWGAHA